MNTRFQFFAGFVIITLASLFAQSPLTPPGTPGLTMKSLDQIESRILISSP